MRRKENNKILFLGRKSKKKIVTLKSDDLKFHTLVTGQSGSGKSFFMGRLIEEIILHTKYRLIIFDLNADFIKIREIEEKIWTNANEDKYRKINEALIKTYKLDSKLDEFKSAWERKISKIKIFGASGDENYKIKISWNKLKQNELYQLFSVDFSTQPQIALLIDLLSDYSNRDEWSLNHWKALPELITRWVRKNYKLDYKLDDVEQEVSFDLSLAEHISYNFSIPACEHLSITLKAALDYEIWNERATDSNFDTTILSLPQVFCINLASLTIKEARLFIIRYVLDRVWDFCGKKRWEAIDNESRKIIPIFVVIDEVHRVAPQRPENVPEILILDLLRQIAAEGRKYSIFLLVATQRPQKLHKDILSECDNVCIMKLANRLDCKLIGDSFGSIDNRDIKKIRKLTKYNAIIAGGWTDYRTITIEKKAPQRTRPCGADISA